MAKDLLQDAGFRTLEAECAEVGLQLAKAHKPDLILLDMNMPQMNGYDTVRLIRTDPELCDTIVIAFTALAMDEELKKAISCGCNNIIAKPINVDTFANSVERFLDLARI
jgi:CheY-like chemotaxis protein